MCGISFLLDRTGRLGPDAAARMRTATAHRGPDGCGSHQFGDGGTGTVYLGHNRLKIVDLSDEASQPMLSADGRYALVFNGEIYNWRELRTELETQGVQFRTQSDTEVLLWLLIRESEKVLPRLRGMFAFVFYDSVEKCVLAGRDSAGIKPLFFADTPRGLAIASEIPAVVASGVPAASFDARQVQSFLRGRFAKPNQTFRCEVFELAPGVLLHVGKGVTQPPRPDASSGKRASETAAPVDVSAIERALRAAVDAHLAADVPVGIWLSGGVDSTLLLALARETGHHPPCFSVGLSAAEGSFGTNDHAFAHRAARQFGAEHHVFEADADLLLSTDAALAALGQPIADSSVLLTWWLASQTRPHVKAVLSGAGADEFFGGYNRHQAFAGYLRHRRWLTALAPGLRGAAKLLPTGYDGPLRKSLRLARLLADRLQPTPGATFERFAGLDHRLTELLLDTDHSITNNLAPATASDAPNTAGGWLNWALHYDQTRFLRHDVLALTDQTAMRHGLEVRTPYLDQGLTAHLNQIPASELFRHGPKWVLRALLDQRGGQAFTQRRKEGFGLPLTRWLRMPKYGWLFDPIRRPDHPLFAHLDYARTQQFLTRFQTGHHDLGAEAWALITLFRWYDLQRFGGASGAPR